MKYQSLKHLCRQNFEHFKDQPYRTGYLEKTRHFRLSPQRENAGQRSCSMLRIEARRRLCIAAALITLMVGTVPQISARKGTPTGLGRLQRLMLLTRFKGICMQIENPVTHRHTRFLPDALKLLVLLFALILACNGFARDRANLMAGFGMRSSETQKGNSIISLDELRCRKVVPDLAWKERRSRHSEPS